MDEIIRHIKKQNQISNIITPKFYIFQLTITFKESLTEVFEYPSYESSLASPESNATSILNAKNTSIGGSFGKF